MRGDNQIVCVLTKSGKPRKVNRVRADEIVSQGGQFISRTRYKALTSGFKVPEKLFKKGDRAVKDFITGQRLKVEQKSRKTEKSESEEKPKKRRKPRKPQNES